MDLLLLSPWTFVEQASYRNPNLRELVIIMDVEASNISKKLVSFDK